MIIISPTKKNNKKNTNNTKKKNPMDPFTQERKVCHNLKSLPVSEDHSFNPK